MYKAFISYSHSADGKLALALQKALEGFAKPWYKLRTFNVFRDEDTLSSTHDLEGNINLALKEAEFLIFLASPASARSKWVKKEIDYWIENKPIEKLIIVLTDGEIVWMDEGQSFRESSLNALPDTLRKKFSREPFYVDLRQVKSSQEISIHNPLFKKEVLKLAAPLHNKEPKDLAGDEVTAHRKMMKVRNGAIGILVLLLIAALVAGFIANESRKEAIESAHEAKRQEGIATVQKDSATKARDYALKQERIAQLARDTAIIEKDKATRQREIAIEQRNVAQANYLTSEARNVIATNPTLALRLLEQAIRFHNTSSIEQAALNVYNNNIFYKSVDDTEIAQSRLNIKIRDTGIYLRPVKRFLSKNELPYLSDFSDKKKIEIELPFKSDYALNFSPDHSHLVAFSKRGEIKLRRVKGTKINDLKIDSVADFRINLDNDVTDVKLLIQKKIILVTEDYTTTVRIFNLDGKHIQDLKGHRHPIMDVFIPDENTIYTSSKGYYTTEEQPNRKWTTRNTFATDFEGSKAIVDPDLAGLNHNMKTDGKTFSPDKKTYLKNRWSDFHYAMLVSLFNANGHLITEFFDPVELITVVSFSPDGKYVFTGLSNGTVKMYTARGMLLRNLDVNNRKEITSFAFTKDKKHVLIYSKDGKCSLLEMPLPLETFLKSNEIETLSGNEKRQYGIREVVEIN